MRLYICYRFIYDGAHAFGIFTNDFLDLVRAATVNLVAWHYWSYKCPYGCSKIFKLELIPTFELFNNDTKDFGAKNCSFLSSEGNHPDAIERKLRSLPVALIYRMKRADGRNMQ